ncbi:hypothetical protein B194_1716 [Serratia plymuthica A30]|jgi:hypothetical protein|nr:hypothetical protein B194_1716 [Serratia plymuthica A30]
MHHSLVDIQLVNRYCNDILSAEKALVCALPALMSVTMPVGPVKKKQELPVNLIHVTD